MKVCFIVPSVEHLNTAGVRIRYERLASHNAEVGLSIVVVPIPDLIKSKAFEDADVYIFSKVYTALAAVLMRRFQERGKIVGVDIFDDYFSQLGDVRLQRYRLWLNKYGPQFDFVLCSTPRIKSLIEFDFPGKPILMIPDPAPACDMRRVSMLAGAKLERALSSRVLDVLWFGIATNPFFPIGIHDLTAFGDELARFQRGGWRPKLTVLTNLNSLQPSHLARLAKLPVPFELEMWSTERENELLEGAFMCFLPVNGQEFSQAKSLNRAISALMAGCQILSNGYPLYEDLADLVCASADEVMADLSHGKMKLRPETIGAAAQALVSHANSIASADELGQFLRQVQAARVQRTGDGRQGESGRNFPVEIAIIQGAEHDTQAHKASGKLGALSIKSPFTRANLNFDVRFDGADGSRPPGIYLRARLLNLVAPELREQFVSATPGGDGELLRIAPQAMGDLFPSTSLLDVPTPVGDLCAYPDVMAAVVSACGRLFPQLQLFISEQGNLHVS